VSGHSRRRPRRRRLPLFVVIIVALSPAIAMARLPRFSLLLFLSPPLSTLASTSRVIVHLFHFLPIFLASSISPKLGSLVRFVSGRDTLSLRRAASQFFTLPCFVYHIGPKASFSACSIRLPASFF